MLNAFFAFKKSIKHSSHFKMNRDSNNSKIFVLYDSRGSEYCMIHVAVSIVWFLYCMIHNNNTCEYVTVKVLKSKTRKFVWRWVWIENLNKEDNILLCSHDFDNMTMLFIFSDKKKDNAIIYLEFWAVLCVKKTIKCCMFWSVLFWS